MLITTITVDADQTAAEAVARFDGLPDLSHVIVRGGDGLQTLWFTSMVARLRKLADENPNALVAEILQLDTTAPSAAYQIDHMCQAATNGIVLDGDTPLGILVGGLSTWTRSVPVYETPATETPLAPPAEGAEGATANDTSGGFKAFPELECPDQVGVGDNFTLVVRLREEESPDTTGGELHVDTDLREFDLVVTVVAPGFSSPRIRDVLHVDRSDPTASEVRFELTAEEVEGKPVRAAILQVDYFFGGQLCGRASRAIVVTTGSPASALHGLTSSMSMSTRVEVFQSERPVDLVVTITANPKGTELEWQFATLHAGVDLPSTAVRIPFKTHNAKSFAMEQIRLLHASIGLEAVGSRVLGTARTIADEIPPEAWRALAKVWRRTAALGRVPSVLLVSSDAYVPWELASTEPAYLDQALVDTAAPPLLGAQVCISRWLDPQPRGESGVPAPQLPPPQRVDLKRMALVIGDYLAMNGIRPLPKATEEGDVLESRYQALRLAATLEEVEPLFNGTLTREGETVNPEIVHFACHGQIDPNPSFNGIVLNEGNKRIDALYVRGNRMQRPFVFLNACQVGQTTELLDGAGGLAGSFLKNGATGFIAPLWNVDDQVAQDTALGFYRSALEDRTTVAEALRQRRRLFDLKDSAPELTHLAYIYYGHPNLMMSWGA